MPAPQGFTMEDISTFMSTDSVQVVPLNEEPEVIQEQSPDMTLEQALSNNEGEETPELVALDETTPATETEEAELPEEFLQYQTKLYKSVANSFADKFGFEIEEDSITDIDSLADLFDNLSNEVINEKWDTVTKANEKVAQVFAVLEKGGDIAELAKLYQEEKTIAELDLSTVEGQKQMLKKYYKEVEGWTDDRINRNLTALEATEKLEEESKDVQASYQKAIEKKAAKEAELQTKRAEQKLNAIAARKKAVEEHLKEAKLPQKEVSAAMDFIFKENYKLGNELYTGLEVSILEKQKKPDELFDLVQFLQNPEIFIKRKAAELNTKRTEVTFNKVLKNQINKRVGTVSMGDSQQNRVNTFTLDDLKQ